MDGNSYERLYPFNLDLIFRRGLGRTLLLCFLALGVLPTALIGAIGYRAAFNRLEQEVRHNIRLTAESISRQLQTFLDSRLAEAERQGREELQGSIFDSTVDRILAATAQPSDGWRVYVVGMDLAVIAGTIGDAGALPVDTAQTRLWRENLTDGNTVPMPPSPLAYAGPAGDPVLGTHAVVRLDSTPYALIVELDSRSAFRTLHLLRALILTIVCLTGAAALVVATALARTIVGPVRELSQGLAMVADGRLDVDIDVTAGREMREMAAAFGAMVAHLKSVKAETDSQSKLMSGLTRLHRLIGSEQEIQALCLLTLEFLADFLDLCQADFFVVNTDGALEWACRFPGRPGATTGPVVGPANAWVDQALVQKRLAGFRKDADSPVVRPVTTAETANLIAVPLMLRQRVHGVLLLEKSDLFSSFDIRFIEAAAKVVAVVVNAALTCRQEAVLLERNRQQAGILKVREAALAASTRNMQMQRQAFVATEEKLEFKQLELRAANAQMAKNAAELEAHMAILEKQKLDMQRQNAELERTHGQLAQKARQLEISSRYKTEFMANMSHELRTPLNSILLLSRLLLENKEKTLTARQSEFARTIHGAGEDLLNLINEILDLAKVEAGKMQIVPAPVQIRSIVDAMRVSFSPLAEQSGVAFTIHVASDVPEQLISDRKRIEQIVKNFLANSFKFTTRGTIRLEIAVAHEPALCRSPADGEDEGCLTIAVADTGIGIAADKHRLIFEAFQQVDGSIRRSHGGTGLGLSISRELARLLGGEITLQSQEGQGSRFALLLPIVRPPKPAPAAMVTGAVRPSSAGVRRPSAPTEQVEAADAPPRERPPAMDNHRSVLKGRKVLLVDDDMRTVFAVSSVLEDQGVDVLAGKTGKESLDKLDAIPDIDLILMDVMISGVDGYGAIREIRSRDRYRTLPIIALTAKAMHGDRAKCIEAGADDYLAKPVDLDNLMAMLTLWLDPQSAAGRNHE